MFICDPEQDDSTLSNSLFFYHGLAAIFSLYIAMFLIPDPDYALEDDDEDLGFAEAVSILTLGLGSMWSIQEVLWGGGLKLGFSRDPSPSIRSIWGSFPTF